MRRNKPSVTTVTGNVSTTSIGFTISLKIASAAATRIAEIYPDTTTPGNIYAKIITANAVSNNFKIQFMVFLFRSKDKKTALEISKAVLLL